IGNVMMGTPPPENGVRNRIAFKTGTSYGYRDAWSVGFDGRYTIGVWVGRPDGAPVPGLVGVDAAAPILVDAFARLGAHAPLRRAPPGALQASTTGLPETLRRFRSPNSPNLAVSAPPEIAYPPRNVRVDLGIKASESMPLVLKVRNGTSPFTWFVDGAPVGTAEFGSPVTWQPSGPGFIDLMVIVASGAAAKSSVYLE
ncbi:MAG TPA: penicillin-binding protein 1C, partial [Propylenella sp.]|nr:penicillin-binding protein 1C [Propylenella sp.]